MKQYLPKLKNNNCKTYNFKVGKELKMQKKISLALVCALILNVLVMTACGKGTSASGDWWVQSEDYEPNGIPIFEVFKMGDDDDTAVYYDRNGQPAGEMDVIREKKLITLDLGFTEAAFILKGDKLIDPDTREVIFVRTDDPGFPEMLSYDGSWYLNGDPNAEEMYVFSGDNYEYKNTSENYYGGDKSGTWKFGPSIRILPTGNQIEMLPHLEAEFPGPTFYPVAGGSVLYVRDGMDYECYVNENSLEGDMAVGMYAAAAELMNAVWTAQFDDYSLTFNLDPNAFQIIPYGIDENGYNNPREDLENWAGTWSIDESDGSLILDFLNGETEIISCDPDADEIYMAVIDALFERG